MASSNKKHIRNGHARNYIEAVFAERLLEEGFVCPDDRLLCWYRVVNKEVVHSLCFFSRWSNVPILMEVAYGIHPLFVPPFYSGDVYISARPDDDERFYETRINEGNISHFAPYSQDVLVYAPQHGGHGVDTFNSIILPQMDSVTSIEQCYRLNRKMHHGHHCGMSPTLIDEAILLEDICAYDNCKRAVDKLLRLYQAKSENHSGRREYKDMLARLQVQKQALFEKDRESFLRNLELRKEKTIALLVKNIKSP